MLIDEEEKVIDTFYANNHGDPIKVVKEGITKIYDKYADKGIKLVWQGNGNNMYGEHLLAKAFRAMLSYSRNCRTHDRLSEVLS